MTPDLLVDYVWKVGGTLLILYIMYLLIKDLLE